MQTSTASTVSITCGRCRGTHTSVDIVRACYQGWTVITDGCGWLIPNAYHDFDDQPQIGECRAEIAYGPDAWICAAGHEHVNADTRHAQGWDYAEDTGDAATLLRAGKTWRPAGTDADIDEAEAVRLALR